MKTKIVIATRESRLALWQAEHVKALLEARFGADVALLPMTTRGDQILDRTLSKVGGKGLFVKELETALADGRADLAVHSLKDVPMDLPDGFALPAVLEREDPRDAFVSSRHASLAQLPPGSVVGSSSLRRVVQVRALRPDVRVEPLRGNLDTRLRKLDEGGYAAIVLAAAGLTRLGLADRIRCRFDTGEMLPCAGQGALAIETRADAAELNAMLATLADLRTQQAVEAERAVSRTLGGSCSVPLAAHAVWRDGTEGVLRFAQDDSGTGATAPGSPSRSREKAGGEGFAGAHAGTLWLRAAVGHPGNADAPLLRAAAEAEVGSREAAEALGRRVADDLLAQGAAAYLQAA